MSRRLALLIHALYGGGAERLMSELASRWAADHEVHLVTWAAVATDSYPISDRVIRHGLDLMRPSRNLVQGMVANARRVLVLRSKLREIDPDWMLSFSDQMNIVALEASRRMRIERWISEHSNPAEQNLGSLWERWRRRAYPTCTGCVVLTEEIAEHMSRLIDRSRIRVIPPAINLDADSPSIDDSPLRLAPTSRADPISKNPHTNVGNRDRRLLFVGRLSTEKRLDVLIDAWRLLVQELPDWSLTIVGDGPLRKTLELQAQGLPRIAFAGWQQQPEPYYRAADLFVLASDYEGFPVSLLEALYYGVPCVSTACSSAIEQLNAYGPAVATVTRGDSARLAEAVSTLARNKVKRDEMSSNARRVALDYNWSEIGKKWDAILG
jgi:GalNAc-alpha-(1->4)-GalNAc-alpha-(1->3)-diNAcBac-PP-undecaprenol alpha-1,4-N-acetyl-D-galactosaminyltransferase